MIYMELNFVTLFLDSILQLDIFGAREGPLGSADPIIKGTILSVFGIIGFSILLNLFNSAIRKKLVDQDKLKRITKETRAWQKERIAAFRNRDYAKQAELNKKSMYMCYKSSHNFVIC